MGGSKLHTNVNYEPKVRRLVNLERKEISTKISYNPRPTKGHRPARKAKSAK